MPALVCDGVGAAGGVLGYPLDQLYEEVAFVAYHFHWSHDEVMQIEHRDRRQWVQEISTINQRMNGD
ncbi:MAG: hypothetical protein IAE79_19870 [Anaerolinea sp.]|nr:hypothetical protein [Anaerolinea sp.]